MFTLRVKLLGLNSIYVLTGSGINTDNGAVVDEQGNLNGSAGLESSGLKSVGSGIALEAGLGINDLELNECGGLYGEDLSLAGNELTGHLFLNESEVVAKNVGIKGNHVEGLGIHEVVKLAVVVGILHILSLNECGLELCGGVKAVLVDGAGYNVLVLGTNESCTLSGLNVLEFDNLVYATVHLKGNAVSEISCGNCCHFYCPPKNIKLTFFELLDIGSKNSKVYDEKIGTLNGKPITYAIGISEKEGVTDYHLFGNDDRNRVAMEMKKCMEVFDMKA